MSASPTAMWVAGVDAAMHYSKNAGLWKPSDERKKLLAKLARVAPDRGVDAFAQLIHGYIARHRRVRDGFDPMAYFTPESLLRAGKRQERWEAYDAAIIAGLSPPFSLVEVLPPRQESFSERESRENSEWTPGRNGEPHPPQLGAGDDDVFDIEPQPEDHDDARE